MEHKSIKINKLTGNTNRETHKYQIKVVVNAADIFDVVFRKSKKPVTKLGSNTEDDVRKRYDVDYLIFIKAKPKLRAPNTVIPKHYK